MISEEIISTFEAEVLSFENGVYRLLCEDEKFYATKAFDCIIEPEIGDTVALIKTQKKLYITNILHREKKNINIKIDGDLSLESSGSIKLSSNYECSIESDTISTQSSFLNVGSNESLIIGSNLNITVKTIRSAGSLSESIFDDTIQKCKNSYEYIEEHKEIQSESMREICDGSKITQVKNYVATAKDQMRFDAETINLA